MIIFVGERERVVLLDEKKNWKKEKEMHAAMHRAVINMPTNLASNWLRIGIVKSR